MKPFNLGEALAGKSVVTRGGRDVKVVYVLKGDVTYPVIVVVDADDDYFTVTKDGKFNVRHNDCNDLFMKEKPFNLEEALAGKPVVTERGYDAKVVYVFPEEDNYKYPICVAVDMVGAVLYYDKNGHDSLGVWNHKLYMK